MEWSWSGCLFLSVVACALIILLANSLCLLLFTDNAGELKTGDMTSEWKYSRTDKRRAEPPQRKAVYTHSLTLKLMLRD